MRTCVRAREYQSVPWRLAVQPRGKAQRIVETMCQHGFLTILEIARQRVLPSCSPNGAFAVWQVRARKPGQFVRRSSKLLAIKPGM